jgi:hypothetical protein
VHLFVRPRLGRARHRRLEVDNPRVGLLRFDFGERFAPDVARRDPARDRPARGFGQLYVVARVLHPALVQDGRRRLGHDLIDAAAEHHVAGEHERDLPTRRICFRDRQPSYPFTTPTWRRRVTFFASRARAVAEGEVRGGGRRG